MDSLFNAWRKKGYPCPPFSVFGSAEFEQPTMQISTIIFKNPRLWLSRMKPDEVHFFSKWDDPEHERPESPYQKIHGISVEHELVYQDHKGKI